MAALKLIGAWGLTEPSNGSDASALQTTARKVSPQAWQQILACTLCMKSWLSESRRWPNCLQGRGTPGIVLSS